MKIFDIIKKFINSIRTPKLPAPKQVETKVIPIICGGANNERILSVLKKEIDKYSDFYKVFLNEYDGICINGSENEFINPLIIEDVKIMDHMTFINPKDNSRITHVYTDEDKASQILSTFENKLLAKYDNASGLVFDMMRKEYEKKLEYSYRDKEKEENFYRSIIKKSEVSNYDSYLCSIRDWKGLRMLFESKDVKDFIERYTESNLFTILNKAIELYTDRSYNNFFEKNIDLIYESYNLTKSDFNSGIKKFLDSVLFVANNLQGGESKEDFLKLLDEHEKNEENKERNRTNNIEIERERIIKLVNEVLNYIDPEQNLRGVFLEKVESGRIIMFNEQEKDDAIEKLEKIMRTKEKSEKYVIKSACYLPGYDVCIIPITNRITDVPTIIHEFIHQYHHCTKKVQEYSTEIPSVFFEKVAIDYLVDNGFKQCEDILQNSFFSRKENDAFNNETISSFIKMTKIKHDEGEITLQNVLTDKAAQFQNKLEQLVYKGRSITDTKKECAKNLINSFANRSREKDDEIVKVCSYSLGTYFAEKYCNDSSVSKEMLKLINDPEYSLQDLISSVEKKDHDLEEKQNVEIEEK